ncbi:MAG: SDR family oxidoreductase [Proteobacteria bacterium]|nr:SDR family oxidoreductase [Pseudomonadota bacterium]
MKNILILGCGYVGTKLAEGLLAQGNVNLFCVKRSPANLPQGVKFIKADILSTEDISKLPQKIDYIIYLISADQHTDEAYEKAYVKGIAQVLKYYQVERESIKKLIYISSTSVYGEEDGRVVDEETPTVPKGFSGERIIQGEEIVRNSGFNYAILRFAGIYGPSRLRLVEEVKSGALKYSANKRYTNRIHRDDCAGIIRFLMDTELSERIFIGVDDNPADLNEIISWIANILGITEIEFSTADIPSLLRGNKRCSNQRLKTCGYVFKYPSYKEGYLELLK